MKALAYRTSDAKPNRLITLTVDIKRYNNPRDAFDRTRRQVSELAKVIRTKVGPFEYLRVLEATKRGWPHYHFVARTEFIPQRLLSTLWNALTAAPIVDIRAIRKTDNVVGYVMKYLGKQLHVPWTDRRVSWSRNFFDRSKQVAKGSLRLGNKEHKPRHPVVEFLEEYGPCHVSQVGDGIWAIEERAGGPTTPLALS